MKDGFSLYDTHAHIGEARHSGRQQSAETLLKAMDRTGIDRSMLIPFPVVEDYRRQHDLIAAAVRSYPDRFSGAACLYPFMPEAEFRQELRRCVEELGLRALKLQPQYQALNPVSRRSDFLFAAAQEHRLPVIVHTGSGVPFSLPSLYILPAQRFPDLQIVLGHAGGSVYMLETIVAAAVCPNVYIEVSSLMPHHVMEILQHVPATRLMSGSDLPESLEAEMHKLLPLADLSDADKRAILWETPRRVFDGA
jgi:predicted TIM-barrel fold metal-dependent hydrolase